MKVIKYFLAVEDPVRLEKVLYVRDRLCWRLIFKTARPKIGIGHLHRVARHRKSHDAHSGGLTEGAGNCWVRACRAVFVWGRDPNPVPSAWGGLGRSSKVVIKFVDFSDMSVGKIYSLDTRFHATAVLWPGLPSRGILQGFMCRGGHAKPGHEASDWRMDVWPGSVVFWGQEH